MLPSLRGPFPESNEAVLQKVKVPQKRGKIVGPELQVSMTFSAVKQSIVSKLLGLSSFGRGSEVVASACIDICFWNRSPQSL
jgi:hypothetical protein